MSKSHVQEGAESFTPITLTIELTKQEDVDALFWLTNTSFDGIVSMDETRAHAYDVAVREKQFLRYVNETAFALIGAHLSRYTG
jgi:hypothetical protein